MTTATSTAYAHSLDSKSFLTEVEILAEEKSPDFSKTLNMAFIGKVSSGKSSLINAILKRNRVNCVSKVGAISGVTTKLKILRLEERVKIIDSPGLDDVRSENSQVTKEFLEHIDVGLLVITGASDATQKQHLDALRKSCSSIFVVLNKIDEWDKHSTSALKSVIEQWKKDLQIDKIYPVCAFGYDPETAPDFPLDLRGVDQLRGDIESFLEKEGKDLLLARQMAEKQSSAIKIIAGALVAIAGQVFLPGSAAFIAATQASAIASLYYIYNGKALAPKAAVALLPCFASQAIFSNVFLFVQSFIPPTGVIDAAAAVTAVITTTSMLAAVNYLLATGVKLEEKRLLQETFRKYKTQASKEVFLNVKLENLKNPDYIRETIKRFITGQAIT